MNIKEQAQDLLAQMTLEEKIGQMTQVDRRYLQNEEDIKTCFIGSLLSGGGSRPASNTPAAWADMYDRYQSIALKTRLHIPLIYGIDAVHGHNNVAGAVIFPHNIGLGATGSSALVEQAARITAEEVAGTGINWTFAPCVAVPQNERWGRTYEGFSESPDLTSTLGAAAVRGFQGKSLSDGGSILACAKHFAGDGGTANGKDQGDTQLDEAAFRQIHLAPYISAIDAGVGSVMASYSSWNGQKMHGHRYALTTILKGELGFEGFVVSDWKGIDQLAADYYEAVVQAVNAGIDMVMVPENYKQFIENLTRAVNTGRVPQERIDDAVLRILKVKYALGLFNHPYADRKLTASIGSASHREVARECVRQSLVLLKNENSILPLSKTVAKIVVAGKNADDLGNQCGGWTIEWQGQSGAITSGTTILQAIKNAVSPSASVIHSADGSNAAGADIAVAVIGETPYAEFQGDRDDLSLTSEDMAVIRNLKNADVPVVTILISGRPLIINEALDLSDAFIAAWLPGSEGSGVSDVLFGDYDFTGRLPHSWPRGMEQIPVNAGDPGYDPLFPFGYGLSYQ
ncbi:MAG: glycoside hydrolase family 3 N-terminal domain-containing protein [Calditrichia bacterium]